MKMATWSHEEVGEGGPVLRHSNGTNDMRNTDEILRVLRVERARLTHDYAVKSLAVFGSVARNEEKDGSDLDLLVEFHQTPGFFKFLGLEKDLSRLTGRTVDLVERRSMKPAIGTVVDKEAVLV